MAFFYIYSSALYILYTAVANSKKNRNDILDLDEEFHGMKENTTNKTISKLKWNAEENISKQNECGSWLFKWHFHVLVWRFKLFQLRITYTFHFAIWFGLHFFIHLSSTNDYVLGFVMRTWTNKTHKKVARKHLASNLKVWKIYWSNGNIGTKFWNKTKREWLLKSWRANHQV